MRDADEDVRFQATVGIALPAGDEPEGDGPVVDALLGALEDPRAEVRDWAVFGLGVLRDVDTPRVREALLARLDDEGADTAGEAAVGLARRGDPRVLGPLLEKLADPLVGNLYVEAAAELADPRLLPLLRQLEAGGWQDGELRPTVLDDAVASCGAGSTEPGVPGG
jgi:HEAT repeat protein